MNQVTLSLSGEPLRLTLWYSPGSGGDYRKERNQWSLDVGGERREGVCDAHHALARAECPGQGGLEQEPGRERGLGKAS